MAAITEFDELQKAQLVQQAKRLGEQLTRQKADRAGYDDGQTVAALIEERQGQLDDEIASTVGQLKAVRQELAELGATDGLKRHIDGLTEASSGVHRVG